MTALGTPTTNALSPGMFEIPRPKDGWLVALGFVSLDDELYHKNLVDRVLGPKFWPEIIQRMTLMTIYTWHECEVLLDDCVAYLRARATMDDVRADLVANLLPDQAWHILQLYNDELAALCHFLCGQFIHHDPAGEEALVNTRAATLKTVCLFRQHGIGHHPALWRDYESFPDGGFVVRTGVLPRGALVA